ncbi:unnamed protein product, partial [Rotaria socialis]
MPSYLSTIKDKVCKTLKIGTEGVNFPVENYLLIWADGNINEGNEDSQSILIELRKVIKNVEIYTEAAPCFEWLKEYGAEKKVVAICSGALSRDLVPKIHNMDK